VKDDILLNYPRKKPYMFPLFFELHVVTFFPAIIRFLKQHRVDAWPMWYSWSSTRECVVLFLKQHMWGMWCKENGENGGS